MRKFFLGSLSCLGLAMALFSALWIMICSVTGMLSWIGFAGCTSYFASGKSKKAGVITAIITNLSGVVWAMVSIYLGRYWESAVATAIFCACISYIIIVQAKVKCLEFIPGAYIGCFTTFAVGGEWRIIIIPIILGPLMGMATDVVGTWLYDRIGIVELNNE